MRLYSFWQWLFNHVNCLSARVLDMLLNLYYIPGPDSRKLCVTGQDARNSTFILTVSDLKCVRYLEYAHNCMCSCMFVCMYTLVSMNLYAYTYMKIQECMQFLSCAKKYWQRAFRPIFQMIVMAHKDMDPNVLDAWVLSPSDHMTINSWIQRRPCTSCVSSKWLHFLTYGYSHHHEECYVGSSPRNSSLFLVGHSACDIHGIRHVCVHVNSIVSFRRCTLHTAAIALWKLPSWRSPTACQVSSGIRHLPEDLNIFSNNKYYSPGVAFFVLTVGHVLDFGVSLRTQYLSWGKCLHAHIWISICGLKLVTLGFSTGEHPMAWTVFRLFRRRARWQRCWPCVLMCKLGWICSPLLNTRPCSRVI